MYANIQEKQVLLNFRAAYHMRVRRLHVQQQLLVQTFIPNCLIDLVLDYSNPTQLSVVQIGCGTYRNFEWATNNDSIKKKRLLLDQINNYLRDGLFPTFVRESNNNIATLMELSENEQWTIAPGTLLAVTSPINHFPCSESAYRCEVPDFIYHYTVFGWHFGAEFETPLFVNCSDQPVPEFKLLDYGDCEYPNNNSERKHSRCCVVQ